jgi:hypothetical protein
LDSVPNEIAVQGLKPAFGVPSRSGHQEPVAIVASRRLGMMFNQHAKTGLEHPSWDKDE